MEKEGSLFSNLASKIKNVDGKLIGKDDKGTKPVSFASIFKDNTPKKTVKLSELSNEESVEGADVAIPLAAVDEVSNRFVNTLYGYFIGKRVAFLIAENYVKNTWAKYGLERVMLHNVGLSLITNKLGRPIMLDAYTSTMCLKSWGRNTYAWALIEVSSKKTLVDSLVVAIPFQDGSGHSMETVDIEYEWQPPRCDTCKIFNPVDDQCPKKVKVAAPTQVSDDGSVEVTRKHEKGKQNGKPRHIDGEMRKHLRYPIKSNVNSEASTSQPKENKEAALQANSNAFSGLEEDNGKLVDDTRKKVEAPPKKTPRKTGIWSGRKAGSPKRNVVFSPTKVRYFDRDDMDLMTWVSWSRKWSMRMPITTMVDGFLMVFSISYE
ncbi:hypothetical protein Tco_1009459 [Tanacetum coccineum]